MVDEKFWSKTKVCEDSILCWTAVLTYYLTGRWIQRRNHRTGDNKRPVANPREAVIVNIACPPLTKSPSSWKNCLSLWRIMSLLLTNDRNKEMIAFLEQWSPNRWQASKENHPKTVLICYYPKRGHHRCSLSERADSCRAEISLDQKCMVHSLDTCGGMECLDTFSEITVKNITSI